MRVKVVVHLRRQDTQIDPKVRDVRETRKRRDILMVVVRYKTVKNWSEVSVAARDTISVVYYGPAAN